MTAIDVINCKGEKVSQAQLPDAVYNVPVKPSVLHAIVRRQLAGRRSGTASVKHRSDVRGSTRKLFRQKGTGRARRGDIKSPLLRGGGVIFGPHPKDHAFKVPKRVRRLGLKMALSSKLAEARLIVLDRMELAEAKTKAFKTIVDALQVRSALIVTDTKDEALERSSRNVPGIKVLRSEGLNVYDVLKHQNLVLLEASLEQIEGRLTA